MNREHIHGLIIKHLNLLDKAFQLSQQMATNAKSDKLDELNSAMANRERLINIMLQLQTQICDIATDSDKEIMEYWNYDINKFVTNINNIDESINNYLLDLKDQTSVELGTMYKNRQHLKGYNLSSVKKY